MMTGPGGWKHHLLLAGLLLLPAAHGLVSLSAVTTGFAETHTVVNADATNEQRNSAGREVAEEQLPVDISHLDAAEHPAPDPNLHKATLTEYVAHLQVLHSLLEQCRAKADACAADKVGSDELVAPEGNAAAFGVHYGWLRDELTAAQNPKQTDRDVGLADAMAHLDEAIAEASGSAARDTQMPDAQAARSAAQRILSGVEYNRVKAPSWWEKFGARINLWLYKFFNGIGNLGRNNPWLGTAMYVTLLMIGLTIGALWMLRLSNRQRLAILRNYEAVKPMPANARLDWLALAKQQAAQQHWRDAVHCLFWASIEVLEQRRQWQPNATRTPREYLRLLEPGTAAHRLLRLQMLGFERIWYGLQEAQGPDYNEAINLYEQLRSA